MNTGLETPVDLRVRDGLLQYQADNMPWQTVVGGTTSRMGSVRQFIDLIGAINGQLVEHIQASRYVRGEFFPEPVPADDYLDGMWTIAYVDPTHVRLRGPAGETFTGELILTIFIKPNTNP